MTDYAWSEIVYDVKRDADEPKVVLGHVSIKPGEEVSAKKLNLTDEQFQELVDSGAVRNYPFPEELQDPLQSPNQLIATALSDAEGVAAAYGVSPELVSAYSAQRKEAQKPVDGEVKKDK